MNRDESFISQLESYLDDHYGATGLPESIRDAVRADLPRTRQRSGRLPSLPDLSSIAPPALAVAAALVLALAVGAFLASRQNIGDSDESNPTPSATATDGVALCERTRVMQTGPSRGTLDVQWCAEGPGAPGTIAFTMDGSFGIVQQEGEVFPGQGTLWLRPDGRAIVLALETDARAADVLDDLTTRAGYDVGAPIEVQLGEREAVVVDIRLAGGVPSSDAPPLVADNDQTLRLSANSFIRVWLVDMELGTLLIATGEDLAESLAEALSTINWE